MKCYDMEPTSKGELVKLVYISRLWHMYCEGTFICWEPNFMVYQTLETLKPTKIGTIQTYILSQYVKREGEKQFLFMCKHHIENIFQIAVRNTEQFRSGDVPYPWSTILTEQISWFIRGLVKTGFTHLFLLQYTSYTCIYENMYIIFHNEKVAFHKVNKILRIMCGTVIHSSHLSITGN